MSRQKQIEKLAESLVYQGTCGLPLTFQDVARRVASHQDYPLALKAAMSASPAIFQGFVMMRACELVDDFLPMEDVTDA